MVRATHPVIGFLTDFGLDGAAATCRGVMLRICPDAQVVDISHTVAKYAIADGAFILAAALPYLPVGVHVGVVDPGVGTERRPIALRVARGDVLVGPDNGLLLDGAAAIGGVTEARELTDQALWLPDTSATFHGRDIFAPVAAHVAAGTVPFEEVGRGIDVASLVRLDRPPASVVDGRIEASVAYVDSFGNLRLSVGADALDRAFGAASTGMDLVGVIGDQAPIPLTVVPSFGHVAEGEGVAYRDSSGTLALGLNRGDLAGRVGASTGTPVRLGRPD